MSSFTFVRGFSALHDGVDLAASRGTPVHAVRGGTVRFAGWGGSVIGSTLESGGGNVVEINDDTGGQMEQYAHLDTMAVSPGQSVAAGQLLGTVGETGNAFGYHLHFGLRSLLGGGMWMDPLTVWSVGALEAAVSGATATSASATSTSSTGGPILDAFLATIGRQLTDPIRSQDVQPFVDYIKNNTTLLQGNPVLDALGNGLPGSTLFNITALQDAVSKDVGKPWSVLGGALEGQAGQAGNLAPDVVGGVVGQIGSAVTGALEPVVLLAAIFGILILGLYLTVAG